MIILLIIVIILQPTLLSSSPPPPPQSPLASSPPPTPLTSSPQSTLLSASTPSPPPAPPPPPLEPLTGPPLSLPPPPKLPSLIPTPTTTPSPTTSTPGPLVNHSSALPNTPLDKLKVCGPTHIRNDLAAFKKLKDCEVINGPLTIALISNPDHPYEPKDYDNITFPKLREVTDFLLFFRVEGLSTLNRLLPNLAVIRGRELVSDYAFIVYEMMQLQEINLPNLNDILRGSVRIELNPNLCYFYTVNWDKICKKKYVPHFIKDNKATCSSYCPEECELQSANGDQSPLESELSIEGDIKRLGSLNNRYCWSSHVCQRMCGQCGQAPCYINNLLDTNEKRIQTKNATCCSEKCAGGCFQGNRSDACVSCKSVLQEGKCVDTCNVNLYEYKGRCLKEQECYDIREAGMDSCSKSPELKDSHFKAIAGEPHGKCQATCPINYQEDELHKNKCKPCDNGKCRKVCIFEKPYTATNINSLKELSGCVVINGSLDLSMKGGKNVINELEIALKDLEEVTGYLKITRSYPLITLSFLENLRVIGGEAMDRNEYSFIVVDNPNLQELFLRDENVTDPHNNKIKRIEIKKGKIFVHLNPKLCPFSIEKMKNYTNIMSWDEKDVSGSTNGDKEACVKDKLQVSLVRSTPRLAMIKFFNYAIKMDDPRYLLYYLINYREVPEGFVTIFDGRDSCFSQNDKWITVEEPPKFEKRSEAKEYIEAIIKIKPATRYALYIKTYTMLSNSKGAMSDIIYFVTAPDTPGIPRNLLGRAKSPNEMYIHWLPPSKPNGHIDEYTIKITQLTEMKDLQNIDVCRSVDGRDKITKSITKDEPDHVTFFPSQTNAKTTNINQSPTGANGTNGQNATCVCENALDKNDADIQQEVVTFQDVLIDLVYCKRPTYDPISPPKQINHRSIRSMNSIDSGGPDANNGDTSPASSSTNNNNNNRNDNEADEESSLIPTTRFEPKNDSTATFVVKMGPEKSPAMKSNDEKLVHLVTGLDHFTSYSIEIRACHALPTNQTNINTAKDYSRCSLQAITIIRSQPKPGADSIDNHTIKVQPKNETSPSMVRWQEPAHPNGQILAYLVRYRHVDSSSAVWTEGCINTTSYNQTGGFKLYNLSPAGKYLLQVKSISMASSVGEWSDMIEFDINEEPQLSKLISIVSVVLVCIILLSVYPMFYLYKKKHANPNDLLAYASVNPDYMQYEPDGWEVDKNNLTVCSEPIGKGSFGMVYKGKLHTEKGDIDCAVKTVPPNATAPQRIEFLNEASIMKRFDTYHVIKLLGVVSASTPVYVIMEYMEKGDLKNYLRQLRPEYEAKGKPIFEGIYLMASQIADGMAYLSTQKYVHRDLAARNCFVAKDCTVKIGDFGMTRDIYDNDYYRRGTQAKLPVRWMAPEALKDNVYTTSSDVWSFGIVVWEMVTFSASPYRGQSNDEVITKVVAGQTLPTPNPCPDRLANLMESCWKYSPADRPTFLEIVEYLLPETNNELSPHSFYLKAKSDETSKNQQTTHADQEGTNTRGTESYPLLSWPSTRTNGLSNGVAAHLTNNDVKSTT